MGWASGAELLGRVLGTVLPFVESELYRYLITKVLIQDFEDFDCDVVYELADDFPEVARVMAEREESGTD